MSRRAVLAAVFAAPAVVLSPTSAEAAEPHAPVQGAPNCHGHVFAFFASRGVSPAERARQLGISVQLEQRNVRAACSAGG